jgi:excisionase family DNA binding protein
VNPPPAVSDAQTYLPEENPREQAELIDFVRAMKDRGLQVADQTALLLGPDGTKLPLPGSLYGALLRVADALSQGLAVTVAPVHTTLTTYQAAEMLGMSRPTLVKLLEDGEIPYEKATSRPGAHRKVKLSDVLDYKERRSQNRRRNLDQMTKESIDSGMYVKPYTEC